MDYENHLNMQASVKNSENSENNSEISNSLVSDKLNSEKTIVKHLIITKSAQQNEENVKKRKASEPVNESAQTRVKKPANANEENRQKTNMSTPTNTVPLSNQFKVLADQPDNADDGDAGSLRTPRKQRAPAPIIIAGEVKNHTELIGNIKEKTKGRFHVKYTAYNISLYLENANDKKELAKAFNKEQLEYHTYTDGADKSHAFIVRGLDGQPTPEQIKSELSTIYKINANQIYKLKNTVRFLYMVTTTAA